MTQQQPYPGGPQGPQGPQYYGPPPKKKHTVRNVFLALLIVGVLAFGGCMALLVGAGNEVSKGIDAETERNKPRDVVVGQAFDIGKHQTLAGWTVKNESGMYNVVGKVKNTSDATSSSFIHFKFLNAAGEVLGNVQCNSGDLEPGQTQALNCIPDGKVGKHAKVTAEATF